MVEQVELAEPWKAVEAEGWTPELVSLQEGKIQGFEHFDKADSFEVDRWSRRPRPTITTRSSARRRRQSGSASVAVICHGPWTLVEAGVLRGRTLTSWPSLQTDIRNAGATWVDEEVHVDGGLVSSRKPDDLPAFCRKLVEEFKEGKHAGQKASAESA